MALYVSLSFTGEPVIVAIQPVDIAVAETLAMVVAGLGGFLIAEVGAVHGVTIA